MERPSARSEDRLLKSLGLAARAGRVRVGMGAVSEAVAAGRAAAVIVAADAPSSVYKRLSCDASVEVAPGRVVLDGNALGRAIGRERVVALAVTDKFLGRRVIELAEAVEAG